MRLLGSLILAVCGCFVFADVTKLKDDSFESFVKSGPSFVYFQKGSSDAHTKQWASFQEAQPKLADTKVQIAFVDCEWKKAKKTCQKFALTKFPTVPPPHPAGAAARAGHARAACGDAHMPWVRSSSFSRTRTI